MVPLVAIAGYAFPPAVPSGLAPGGMPEGDHQCPPQVETKAAAAGATSTIGAVSIGVP